MSEYFNYFPNTIHNKKLLRDITRRVNFTETSFYSPYVFLPFTIESGEKPEDVAYYYYGDVKYTWLVYLSAGIIDPYYDWPMDPQRFESYIMKKYEKLSNTTGYEVISWTQNTEIDDNIIHYYNINDDTIISKDTFNLSKSIIASEWRPLRYYDYESQLNDSKRSIFLIDEKYKSQAEKELKELLDVRTR